MEITETIHVISREEWRNWLQKNHKTCKEIWLIYYKKHTQKPRIPYDDAVEEALCFGWIDSIVKRVNDEYYVQRFTPRKKRSEWSLLNVLRIKKMIALGKVAASGMKTIEKIDLDKIEHIKKTEKENTAKMPDYIISVIQKNKKATTFFNSISFSEQNRYVQYIESAKKEITRRKRISETIYLLERNLKIGMK